MSASCNQGQDQTSVPFKHNKNIRNTDGSASAASADLSANSLNALMTFTSVALLGYVMLLLFLGYNITSEAFFEDYLFIKDYMLLGDMR